MNAVIFIIGLVAFVALVLNFYRINNQPTLSDLIEKINFAIGTENKTLKQENETLKKKNVFFEEWFVRSYIEQYYRKKLALDDHQIYTVDALENLKCYAITALNNFDKTWNYEACNEQCTWIKEYLEELISKIDSILDDKFGREVIDSENEDAFRRFFIAVETSMFFDRNAKENGSKLEELTYWKPAVGHEDLC